ncbi:MAG: NAD-dependent DNA ligase [Gammaproteobacteria bacterium]|nr:NAD-dependent DNA ligase [Gammaproteobacteria bacterium]
MYAKDKGRIKVRDLQTLVGICKGMVADGVVNQQEGEYLLNWLRINDVDSLEDPRVSSLFDTLEIMFEDDVLNSSESRELFQELLAFSGEISIDGEPMKPVVVFDEPPPRISFQGSCFEFIGDFLPKDTKCNEYREVVLNRGGVLKGVSMKLDYLVIAQTASDQWKYGSYGTKIEKAIKYRAKKGKPAIISEAHFIQALKEGA